VVDGLPIEGMFRSHQVQLSDPATHPKHLALLEDWMRSYRPSELFDDKGRLIARLPQILRSRLRAAAAPTLLR
jgi:xylulose-5-phosphate/fructose-6-phosphate phosphoketolase